MQCLGDDDSRIAYHKLEAFWVDLFKSIPTARSYEWVIPFYATTFANGEPFLDGNPIFSAACIDKKIVVRILQAKDGLPGAVVSWPDSADNGSMLEYVISVSSTTEVTCQIVRSLITIWLNSAKVKAWQDFDGVIGGCGLPDEQVRDLKNIELPADAAESDRYLARLVFLNPQLGINLFDTSKLSEAEKLNLITSLRCKLNILDLKK